jgi:hypothetical protein
MISKGVARPQTAYPWPPPAPVHDEAAARIIAEFAHIVGQSRRRSLSGLRRALKKLGSAFGGWLGRMAPPAPPSDSPEPPSEIRFPFF